MPEFMGRKITRAEESARHAYRRSLEKALRTEAKGTGWKSAQGWIFREEAGWFIDVSPGVHIYEHLTEAIVRVKPMAIDPVFWDLVGLANNREQPLSFRAGGAWTCRPPYFAQQPIEEDCAPIVVARRLIDFATACLDDVKSYSMDAFLGACRGAGSQAGSYLPSVVATLVALHRPEEALAVCEEAQSRGDNGGFLAPEGSFVDMAVAYLRRLTVGATRH